MSFKYSEKINSCEEKVKSEQQAVIKAVEDDFIRIGWTRWTHEQHVADGQYERLVSAMNDKKLKLASIDRGSCAGVVEGSSPYDVSGNGCTCQDFMHRQLPCKHMYLLISELLNESSPDHAAPISQDISLNDSQAKNEVKKRFAISGDFETTDKEGIMGLVYSFGGVVSSSVSKKTDYLIVGNNAGLKLKKAEEFGTKIITEKEFLEMIKKPENDH